MKSNSSDFVQMQLGYKPV